MLMKLISSIILFLTYSLVTNFLIGKIMNYFRKDWPPGERIAWLGFFEIVSYMLALLLGYPYFIGLWLIVKVVSRLSYNTSSRGKNIFLIGNLITILIAVIGALFLNWYLTEMGIAIFFEL